MKKIILTVCFLSLFSTVVRAEAFKIGENRASFGIGLGWKDKNPHSKSRNFPSPNVLVERSILPFKKLGFLSIGAQFGFHHGFHKDGIYAFSWENRPYSVSYNKQSWTSVYFIPRVALYFHEVFYEDDFPENIDLYAGIGLGFNVLSHKIETSNEISGAPPIPPNIVDNGGFQLGYHFFVGGRYYFKKHASVFAEIGYGLSFLNVGLTIRY